MMFMGFLSLGCLAVCFLIVSYFVFKIRGMEVSDGGQYG